MPTIYVHDPFGFVIAGFFLKDIFTEELRVRFRTLIGMLPS